jgi:hypothetical protein
MTTHPSRTLGYAIEHERPAELAKNGIEPRRLLNAFKTEFPAWNNRARPDELVKIEDQGQIGSCQGQSLTTCAEICYFLATGRTIQFSRMAAYILSQKFDGLIGRDVGSTLSGGQKVATQHGFCLEPEWPYPSSYSPRIPTGIEYPFKLASAKPTNDPGLLEEAMAMGLPVQTGLAWNQELEQEVVRQWTGRAAMGGHATVFWQRSPSGYWQINSWGRWNGDGMNEITPQALRQLCARRDNQFVIYAPTSMKYPVPSPASL